MILNTTLTGTESKYTTIIYTNALCGGGKGVRSLLGRSQEQPCKGVL